MDHLSDRLHQFALQLVLRWRQLHDSRSRLLRLRQRPLIDFLVLVQGDALNLHRRRWYHVRWFAFQDEVVQCFDIYLLIADHIGCNILSAVFVIEGLHGDVFDSRELLDNSFHFAHLDTEAANLHLTVATAYELQVAVWQPAHDIASAIAAGE